VIILSQKNSLDFSFLYLLKNLSELEICKSKKRSAQIKEIKYFRIDMHKNTTGESLILQNQNTRQSHIFKAE
jgi:hypothetical protein